MGASAINSSKAAFIIRILVESLQHRADPRVMAIRRLLEAGFTGERPDKNGTKRFYRDGRQVKNPTARERAAIRQGSRRALPAHQRISHDEAKRRIGAIGPDTPPEHIKALANDLMNMSYADLIRIKQDLGARGGWGSKQKMSDRLQQGVERNELPETKKQGLQAVRVKRGADGRGIEVDDSGESNRIAWQTPDGKLHSTAIGAYGHLKQNRHLVEPKAKRVRKSRAKMTLLGIVAKAGGITPRSVKAMANYKEDVIQGGLLHGMRKQGTDISKMAEIMERQGHFRTPAGRHADDYLLELLAGREESLLAAEEHDYDKDQEEFYRAQQAAQEEGNDERSIETSRRRGEEAGEGEGYSEVSGWDQPGEEGAGGEEEEYDRSEPAPGEVDSSFDFGANAQEPEPQAEEPGFTGIDAEGREWRNGELVAAKDEPGQQDQPKGPDASSGEPPRNIPPPPNHLSGWDDYDPKEPLADNDWSDEEKGWHRESQHRIRAQWPALREQYIRKMGRFDDEGNLAGLTLNTDEWRGHFEGYQGTNSHIFQDAASYANKRLLHEAFVLMKGKGNNTFLMLGGGAGSGKSSALALVTSKDEFPIIFDTVAGNHQESTQWLDLANGHGFGREFVFVDRNPSAAWKEGVVKRAIEDRKRFEEGDKSSLARTVPLAYALQSNLAARKTALKILQKGNIRVVVISNNGGFGSSRPVEESPEKFLQDGISAYNKDRLFKELFDETRRLYESGEIPGDLAQGLLGKNAIVHGHDQLRHAPTGDSGRLADERGTEKNLGGVPNQGALDQSPDPASASRNEQPGQDSVTPAGAVHSWARKHFKNPEHARNFTNWFGNSKVTNDQGEPLLVYHGTGDSIQEFDLDHGNRKDTGWLGTGVYTTTDHEIANSYANLKSGYANVLPLYVAVKNPFYATKADKDRLRDISQTDGPEAGRRAADEWTQELVKKGHDGVILEYPGNPETKSRGSREIVAFSTTAVKSALGNRGTFDPSSPKITEAVMPADHAAKVKLVQDIITRMGAKPPQPKKTREAEPCGDPRVRRIRELLATR